MSFDDMLLSAVSEIDIPDMLSPENMKKMLDNAAIVQEPADSVPELLISEKLERMPERTKRISIMRSVAAVAACAALAGGVLAMNNRSARIDPLAGEKIYEAVQQPSSYDELYSIYSGIYNSHELSREEIGDGEELITGDDTGTAAQGGKTGTKPAKPGTASPVQTAPDGSVVGESSVGDLIIDDPEDIELPRWDFSNADIVQRSDNYIFYLCDGTVYSVGKDDMTVAAAVDSEYSPFEMDIYGDTLLLISRETDESGGFVTAEIYDISTGVPRLARTYRQDGRYICARTDECGVLYLVTSCSKSGEFSGDYSAPLESYVPRYYVNGERFFIEASDIRVPCTAADVDYTVVSTVPLLQTGNNSISVKAVLGGGSAVYCTEDTLYVAGVDRTGDGDVTYITSFALSQGRLDYKAEGSVSGALLDKHSFMRTDGLLRIACTVRDSEGVSSVNIYSLDDCLNITNAKRDLARGRTDVKVRFEGSTAWISESGEPMVGVDINEVAAETAAETVPEPVQEESFTPPAMQSAAVGDQTVSLTLYDGMLVVSLSDEFGSKIASYAVSDLSFVQSAALADSKAIFIDADRQLVGIPVSGNNGGRAVDRYYLLSAAGGTLTQAGMAEFDSLDSDAGYTTGFDRAVIEGEDLILVGTGRMITVDLYTFAVKDIVTF